MDTPRKKAQAAEKTTNNESKPKTSTPASAKARSRRQDNDTRSIASDEVEVSSLEEHMKLDTPVQNRASEDEAFAMIKTILLERLTGRRPIPLTGLDKEYNEVNSLLQQTVAAGEGNSMLVIGARGSGKSALVNKAITELSNSHDSDFHVIRLHGSIHTDDKLALREIWRQLRREMSVDDDTLGKNYADTLATLLALLSHRSTDGSELVSQSVVFVLDEFDLFAAHPRQTLLYNLFDNAQSNGAPIAVLGLTTRFDVAESMEKRVKSRFSHRYVHVPSPKSFATFQEICKAALLVQPKELSAEAAAWSSALTTWNSAIDDLFASTVTSPLIAHLRSIYHKSKSIPDVLTLFLPLLATLPSSPPVPSSLTTHLSQHLAHPASLATLLPADSSLALLPHLSHLELALLIAAARLDIIDASAGLTNFGLAYQHYASLVSRGRVQASASGAAAVGGVAGGRLWGKEVAAKAWERLGLWGLVVPVAEGRGGGGMGGAGAGGGMAMAMCRVDVSLEEIGASCKGAVVGAMAKWCSQI
ncbi:hypothetical protein B0A49_00576 [Cryomyces minteri]|uniref:Origin recognition complex subunit 4 n=1 Tax=Cryomyces minteri TaxID=331657 RepID=A0A4U0XVC8_9PEZI|nr:hypothetical protein B0A49_00576 [Cryomyces minteri]